jgi:hypothetical protein
MTVQSARAKSQRPKQNRYGSNAKSNDSKFCKEQNCEMSLNIADEKGSHSTVSMGSQPSCLAPSSFTLSIRAILSKKSG